MNEIKNDEVDLVELFKTLWNSKWQIILFSLTCFIFVFSYQQIWPNKQFTSTTLVKPITSYNFQEYLEYNSKKRDLENFLIKYDTMYPSTKQKNEIFLQITPKYLLSLFLDKLAEQTLFVNTIKKYNLIDKKNYDDAEKFNEAVSKLALQLKIDLAENEFKFEKDSLNTYSLKFEYHDLKKWKKALSFLVSEINMHVQKFLIQNFKNELNKAKTFKAQKIYELNKSIENEISLYDYKIKIKLLHLQEQASIARRIGLKRDEEKQIINLQNNVRSNDQYPLYFRGYEALEEEIRLIKKRVDKKTFIPALKQLELEINSVQNDNTIKNFEKAFNNSPINNQDFKAVLTKLGNSDIDYHSKNMLYLFLSIAVGLIIGFIFVMIKHAFFNREQSINS